jgi:hypothetical protein
MAGGTDAKEESMLCSVKFVQERVDHPVQEAPHGHDHNSHRRA